MDMNPNPNSGPGEQSGEPAPRISKARLKRDGWREVQAFIAPSEQPPQTVTEEQEPRSDAERKADQRKRQHADGLKQLNDVIAPDDDDARALVMQVAKAIKSKPVRRDIAAVLADRDLVKIGRKVRRLHGNEADQVRALLKL
ncbi:hypothetical protein ACVWXL_005855 [Bradyrhizobium sp. GM22.5]